MSLLDNASLVLTPNAVKASKLYSVIPDNGNGDFTATRATTATRINSSGLVESVALNVPRVDYSLGGCPNILLEPQRTNSVRNSSTVGAVVGSPGTLPNGWSSSTNSMSRAVVGLGTENGLPYVDIRIFGTATSGTCVVSPIQPAIQSAASGQVWSGSLYVKLIAAPLAPVSYAIQVVEWVGSSFLAATTSVLALSSSLKRFEGTRTLNNASTTSVTHYFSAVVIAGQTYDFTVRIAAPQLELGAYPTSYIPTTTASVTRNADTITRNNIFTNGLITASGGTWFVELRNNRVLTRDNTSLTLNLVDTSGFGNNALYFRNAGANRLSIGKTVAGVVAVNLYTTTTDTCKIAIKWNGSTADIFENGIKVIAATTFTGTALENLLASPQVSTFINEMALFPTPLTDAQCIALTQ